MPSPWFVVLAVAMICVIVSTKETRAAGRQWARPIGWIGWGIAGLILVPWILIG